MSKIIFGKMLDYYRKKNNLTMEELGKKMGKTKSAVSRWISGDNYPKVDDIEKLTQIFNTDVETLIFGGQQDNNEKDLLKIYRKLFEPRQHSVYTYAEDQLEEQNNQVNEKLVPYPNAVPHPGGVAAGKALAYGDTSYDQVTENVPEGADVALTVHGNSMEPLIKNNSIIFFKSQPVVENGEIAIVEINNNEVTCKKFYKEDGKIILRSINEDYDDMVFEDTPIRILGKVLI